MLEQVHSSLQQSSAGVELRNTTHLYAYNVAAIAQTLERLQMPTTTALNLYQKTLQDVFIFIVLFHLDIYVYHSQTKKNANSG